MGAVGAAANRRAPPSSCQLGGAVARLLSTGSCGCMVAAAGPVKTRTHLAVNKLSLQAPRTHPQQGRRILVDGGFGIGRPPLRHLIESPAWRKPAGHTA